MKSLHEVTKSDDLIMIMMCLCTRIVPGVVENLICAENSSPAELSFSWEQPAVLGNEVVGYQVTVNRLEHRTGIREVVQSSVYDNFVEMKDATVSGLGKDNCDEKGTCFVPYFYAAGEVPYNITVKALNLAGCGEEEHVYCFTQEGGKRRNSH